MPRSKVVTGRPPGRPKGLKRHLKETGTTPEQFALAKEKVEAATQGGPVAAMTRVLDVPPLIPMELPQNGSVEDRARAATDNVLENMHPLVPQMLQLLAVWEPEKALRIYADLLEYRLPKLSRVEHKGDINHTHSLFIPVEEREERPEAITLVQDDKGEYGVPK